MIWQVSWLAESDLLLKQGLESTTEGLTVCVREAVPVSLQCFGCTVLAFCLTVFLQSLGLATDKSISEKRQTSTKGFCKFKTRRLKQETILQWREYPGRGVSIQGTPHKPIGREEPLESRHAWCRLVGKGSRGRERGWRRRRAVTAHTQKYLEPTTRKGQDLELQMLACQYNVESGKEVDVHGRSSPWKDFSAKTVVHVKAMPEKAWSWWKIAGWLTSPKALPFPSLLAQLPAHTPLLARSFWGLSFICLSTSFCRAHPEQGWHVSYYYCPLEARGAGDFAIFILSFSLCKQLSHLS